MYSQDENAFYCAPPEGSLSIGKQCEWKVTAQCNDGFFKFSIPSNFIKQMNNNIATGIIQFCNKDMFQSITV